MSKMLLAVAIVVLGAWTCWAQELAMVREEGFVRSLNGQWEFAPEGSNVFDKVPVPGNWSKSTQVGDWKQASALRGGTYRRSFDVPSGVTGVALEFDAIRWGGEVLVNGKVVGKGILGNSPLWADASAAVKEGPNVLEVRPRGWPALERFQTGDVQIPSGAAQWFGSKMGGIPEDAWVRFYRGARVGTVRVTPRFAGPSCGIAVEVMAPSTAFKGKLCARILSDDGSKAYSQVARQEVDLVAGQTVEVTLKDVAAREAPLWSIEAPQMCRATVWLEADGQKEPASVREESFGFREITIRDGHVQINGRRVALHGFTGGIWPYDAFISRGADDDFKKWQVTLFRAMHDRAFRCHMEPMPREWLDLCDRNGILVIPEFPNFPDIQRQPNWSLESPYDRPIYWQNLQREISGIVKIRFNHPCIVGWSASNEGSGFGDWERANLYPYTKKVDPTRLVLFSSDVTADVADSHLFLGNWYGTQAEFDRAIAALAAQYKDRPIGCTEYGQYDAGPSQFGKDVPQGLARERAEAQLLMEQTEALRRNRCDLIMPYWTPDRQELDPVKKGSQFQSMRNVLSPLGVSLDLAQRHATAGGKMEVPVWVMSDDDQAQGKVTVDVALLSEHPGFAWDGQVQGKNASWTGKIEFELGAWEAKHQTMTVQLPPNPGHYTLAAVAHCDGGSTISLRPLEVVASLVPAERSLKVGVIETDGRLEAWLRQRGHRVVLPYGDDRPDVVIVAEGQIADGRLRNYGFAISSRVKQGMRLVILEQRAWHEGALTGDVVKDLTGVALRVNAAWVFAEDAALVAALGQQAQMSALPGEMNGCDGIGLRVRLALAGTSVGAPSKVGTGQPDAMVAPASSPATAPATMPAAAGWTPVMVAYTRGREAPDWAIVRGHYGKGEVLCCQVPVMDRVDPAKSSEYDPVAQRLLGWLVETVP